LDGDADGIGVYLHDALNLLTGLDMLGKEHDYQIFILGILTEIIPYYHIRPEWHGGDGYADIVITPNNHTAPSYVIELKKSNARTPKGALSAAKKALEQIHDREYFKGLNGTVYLYGIAFVSQKPTVLMEKLELPRVRL